jgi:hypothetical protein
MKKSELKQLIKPVVKECIHEVLLEEGLLSNVVSEVVKGMHATPLVEAARPPQKVVANKSNEASSKLAEHRKMMLDAVGRDSYNGVDLFEGTSPISNSEPRAGQTDLGAPGDAGVDISSIVGSAAKLWQHMK